MNCSFLNLFRKKTKTVRTPLVLQMETSECGIAALSIVLKFFGKDISIEQLRDDFGQSRNGTKASTIIKIARKYQLKAQGFKVQIGALEKLSTPMILFWNHEHYVVYEGCSSNGKLFYVNDPQCGHITLDRESFERGFSGIALTFERSADFQPCPGNVNKKNGVLRDKSRTLALIVWWAAVLFLFPVMAVPILFSVYVDFVLMEHTGWPIAVCILFLIAMIIKLVLIGIIDLSLRRIKLQKSANALITSLNLLFSLPMRFFIQRSNGEIQTKVFLHSVLSNEQVLHFKNNSLNYLISIYYLVLMTCYNWKLMMVVVCCALLYVYISWFINRRQLLLKHMVQSEENSLFSSVVSNLSSVDVVKALGREKSIFNIWVDRLSVLNSQILKLGVRKVYLESLLVLITLLSNLVVFSIGLNYVIDGSFTLGNLLSFQILVSGFVFPLTQMITDNERVNFIEVNERKIQDLYSYRHEDSFADPSKAENFGNLFDEFRSFDMKNISFKYEEQGFFIKNFSLHVEPGMQIAIVGASGSGKSTIVRLISGMLQPSDGEILLNGCNIRRLTADTYYSNIDIVEQTPTFYSGTVQDNLTMFSQTFDYESLQDALKRVGLVDELSIKGAILSQTFKEGGINFSAGQLQRFEMARVFANQKPLAVFDEATCFLDSKNNREICASIRKYVRSYITVSHNLSTVKDADEIIVMDHGEIVGRGRHPDLCKNNKYYQKLMLADEEGIL